jgi:hypothetical protein
MAAYQAIIDLIVNGQNEVDRVIRSTDQLQAAIGRINSRPLELQPGRAQQSVERLTRSLQGIDRQVEQAAAHLTPLRNNFQAVSREAGTLDRALQRNSRSLEVNRRQSQIYENTIRNAANGSIEFVNAIAAGARAVERNIRLTEQQTQLERRRAAVDARMTYQLRQMAGAEADLAEAQERRGQAAASLGSARGFQVQIQFANRLASSYMDIAVSRERAEGTAQGARLPQFQSTAGLRSEIQFFDNLASSVATNTEAFKTFTIASRAASQSLAEVNRNRLAILAEAFTPDDPFGRMRGTSGRQLRNQDVSRTRQEVDRLIASFDQVPRSEAGLEDYIQRLGDLRSVVTFTSNAYRQLTDQMARVQALQGSIPTMRGQASAIRPLQGPASLLPQFSAQSAQKQAQFRERQIADMWKMRGGPALPTGFTERGRVSNVFGSLGTGFSPITGELPSTVTAEGQKVRNLIPGSPSARLEEAQANRKSTEASVALAMQKQKAIEAEAEQLRRGTAAATALGKQKLKALEQEAERLRSETRVAVALSQQKTKEEQKIIADMWKMRGGPALPAGFTERGRISSEFGALGTAFLPVSGKMPGGQAPAPGSPQAKKEEADLQKKINSALIQQEELQGRIDRANLTDFQRQELTNRLLSARDAILKGNFDTSRAISGQVDLTRYSYERYNRDLVKSSKLASDLEKYTKQALGFASRLENISPAMFDSSDLDAFVNRFGEIEGIYKDLNKESKEAGRDFDQRLKATGPFKDRLVELQTLSNDLAINSKRGVQVDQERAKVASLIQKLESGTVQANQQNLRLVSDMTASLKKRLALRISEAKVAGTYETGRGAAGAKTIAPERVEDAVRRLRARANAVESAAISLQGKGAANADQLRLQVQEKINELKKLEGNITRDNAESVARDLGVLQRGILDISNALGEARNQVSQVAALTGFEGSFQKLQTSFAETGSFFQNVSPEEAIDKIVRQFTPSLAGTTGLAALEQLEKPAKLSSQKLTLLASGLQELAAQIDPLVPGAKRLLREMNGVSASLQNEQAGRAPDADFLVRLTKNPRLAAGISEGLIGGAFPLLFGQGVGAAAGGGIGGFAGGYAGGALGFGLSLIGTAVGSAVDTTVNNLKELASSLKEPTAALEAMKTAGLGVSSELEDTVARLEGVGNAAAAQALVLAELEKKLGVNGVRGIRALEAQQKELESQWQEMAAALTSFLIPALVGATAFFSDIAQGITGLSSIRLPGWLQKGIGVAANAAVPAGTLTTRLFGAASERGRSEIEASTAASPKLKAELQRQQQLLPFQQTTAALSAGLEASDIAKKYTDAIKTAAEEQESLDEQRFELIESYEKSIADIRRGVEQRITQERLSVIAKENELFAAQGEVRLQQLRNANAELRATVFGNEIGQQLIDAVSEFTEKQLSTENEVANRRRSLELELESKRIEIEQYRIDVAKQVSDLNLSTQKQVEKINDGILKKNQAYDRSRFEIEKRININNLEIKRLEAKQQENLFRGAANNSNPAIAKQNRELADLYANQATFIEAQKNAVKSFAPPPQLSFGSVSANASVSTAGLDALSARAKQLATAIASVQNELSSLVSSGDFIGFNARLKEIADQGVTGLINQFEQLRGELSNDPLGAQFAKIGEAFEAVSKAPEIAPYKELVLEYQRLAEANVKLGASLEFFLEKGGQQSSQLDSLRVEINSAISGTTELEKAMMDLTQRGISPASEEFKILTENAARIDALQQKLQTINNFKTASSGLTLSLRGLVEGFYELGSASEAVKRVGEELGRKSLGFVLDIAFKPVEQAMQKTMFDLAERLGFDIKPEQLQQLEEIKILKDLVASIEREIVKKANTVVSPTLGVGAPASEQILTEEQLRIQGLVRGLGSQIQKRVEEVFGTAELEALRGTLKSEVNLLLPPADINPNQFRLIKEGAANEIDRQVNERLQKLYPQLPPSQQLPPQSSLPGAFTGFDMASLSKLDTKYASIASERQVFPLPIENYSEAEGAVQKVTGAVGEMKDKLIEVPAAAIPATEAINQLDKTLINSNDKVTEAVQQNAPKLQTATTDWGKSLGQVVTGLSLASSAVIGIVGGVQNIQKGGAGNVLSGIGSILTTVGSIGMSAAGFMKPGGAGGPAAAGNSPWTSAVDEIIPNANGNIFEDGELMKFANGGILQSPTLFSFEDAGVTRTGQAGEAGAEAIMPLKRTKDGRLGVEADLSVPFEASDALEMGLNDGDDNPRAVDLSAPFQAAQGRTGSSLSVPFQRAQGRMSAAQMMQIAAESGLAIPFAKDQGAALGSGGADGGDDTIKFESVIINNQEFVTRKEAEEIGRKAEARGASRGAQLAQKGIKNNPRVRASLGIK